MKLMLFILVMIPTQLFAYIYPPSYVYQSWFDQTKSVERLSYDKVYMSIDRKKPQSQETVQVQRPGLISIENQSTGVTKKISQQQAWITDGNRRKNVTFSDVVDPLEFLWIEKQYDIFVARFEQFYGPSNHYRWFLFEGQKHWMHGRLDQNFILFSTQDNLPVLVKKGQNFYQFFYDLGQPVPNRFIPQKIVVFENQQPVEEILIQNVKINPSISPQNFQ